MQPESPYSRPEILAALASAEEEVATFFGSLGDDEIVLRSGDAWTPLEQLAHLNTSVSGVARGFAMPRWLLRLRFGRVRADSRSFDEVRAVYRATLAGGAGATDAFVPSRRDPAAEEVGARRAETSSRWRRVNARLKENLEKWSERQLDRVALPHPLLGKLTAREMLFFTVYHNRHHIEAAKRRLPRFDRGRTPEAEESDARPPLSRG